MEPVRTPAADPAAAVVEEARALVDDLSLGHVRRWRERSGGIALGYLPIWVPRPLFEAIGALPVAVFGAGEQLEIIRGDSCFQSYICHIPRSTIELGFGGHLDVLDGMLFPSTCDVIRNLGGMWRMLFPGRFTAYLDLPQTFDLEVAGGFFAGELRRIARELEAIGALRLADDALARAIAEENERRRLVAELDRVRVLESARVRASEAYLVVRAGTLMPAKEHSALLRRFLDAIRARPVKRYDNVRVGLVGAFCEQPPLGLVRTLEQSGCDVVFDDLQLGTRYIEGDIRTTGDGVRAIAESYLTHGSATAARYVDKQRKGEALLERVRSSNADGVIFAAASFCDPALLDQPMLEEVLRDAGVPSMSLKFAENTSQHQAVREQAGAFSDAVKLWGNAP